MSQCLQTTNRPGDKGALRQDFPLRLDQGQEGSSPRAFWPTLSDHPSMKTSHVRLRVALVWPLPG